MMEYSIDRRKPKNSRFTIGYLDDNEYNEAYSQVMIGVYEAARKYDINIIRFGYYTSSDAYRYTNQVSNILDLIGQYDLDGLIFLGWTEAAAMYNHDDFTKRFSSIPTLSIGSTFSDIPNVYFPGDKYIREILLHLINVHHYRKIAYIAPRQPDGRNTVYIETMKEYGIFNPDLYVDEKETGSLDSAERIKRALKILLDDRKVKLDAILSLNSNQTWELLSELKNRGLEIPKDVAITSYDDGYIGNFSVPSLTTVHYPWVELGYQGCEKMVELLTYGNIPFSTPVLSKIIYRNSCGCMSNMAGVVPSSGIVASEHTLFTITEFEKSTIVNEMEEGLKNSSFDFNKLVNAFLKDFQSIEGKRFIGELELQFKSALYNYNYQNMEEMLSLLRKLLMPYVINSNEMLVRLGSLFQQFHIYLREKLINTFGHAEVDAKNLNQTLQEISQALITKFSMQNLIDSLEANLHRINIPSCYIILFDSIINNNANDGNSFSQCLLKFEYNKNSGVSLKTDEVTGAHEILSRILADRKYSCTLFTHFLHFSDEFMGFVMFEQGPIDESVYQALSIHISTALMGVVLVDRLEKSYKTLIDQAYKEGMADIVIGILHNIGNVFNSVNLSIYVLRDLSASHPFKDIERANNIIRMKSDDPENVFLNDEKGKKLLRFYTLLGKYMDEYKEQLIYHLDRIENKTNWINNTITAQQAYAGINSVFEELDLSTVIEDALTVNLASFDKYNIHVSKDYKHIPKVIIQRGKLFHTLVNLINIAKDSMIKTPLHNRELTISLYNDDMGKYIRITDTGCGIHPSLLKKIFEYDRTSKDEEKRFELFSCANYMQEIGGSIRAESNGIGEGSSFILHFP